MSIIFFLFFSVSYIIYIYICPGVGYPYLFLGVAIGLELRIRLWHMFLIGRRRSGNVCLLLCTLTLFANFASTAPMSFRWLLQKSCLPGLSFVSLPSFRRVGCLWKVSGCPSVLPEGFPLLPIDLVRREGWRSLWSRVRCTQARFCLLGSFVDWGYRSCFLVANSCYFFCPGWLSLLISVRSTRFWGRRVFGTFFLCSRLSLPPHLCTLDEVVKWVRLPSAAPVRVPPWPPDLRLGRPGGSLSPLLVEWLSFAVLLLMLSLRLPCSVKRSRPCVRGSSR